MLFGIGGPVKGEYWLKGIGLHSEQHDGESASGCRCDCAIFILSSAAHSLLGWKGLSGQLAAAKTPSDLVRGLEMGWQFGGVAMLAFGVIVVALFAGRLRGLKVSALPAVVIGVAYVAFGCWSLTSEFSPFFLLFVLPGVLLLFAAW